MADEQGGGAARGFQFVKKRICTAGDLHLRLAARVAFCKLSLVCLKVEIPDLTLKGAVVLLDQTSVGLDPRGVKADLLGNDI